MKKLLIILVLLTSVTFGSDTVKGRSPFVKGCIDINAGKKNTPFAMAVYGFVDGVIMSHYITTRGGIGIYRSTTDTEIVQAMVNAQTKYRIKEDAITLYFTEELKLLMDRKFK